MQTDIGRDKTDKQRDTGKETYRDSENNKKSSSLGFTRRTTVL